MRKSWNEPSESEGRVALDLARVLLVHGELAPRLALQTILKAGGYAVDVAATPAEAISKLDEGRYELVLSDAELGSRPAGRNVLAYARVKDYRPATALVTSYEPVKRKSGRSHQISIYTENLPSLLGEVAELIGVRASRRYRPLRQAV
ncbi:MAG TPA: response regulator [Bryobacteraceae bacterium]|nr:response regulator [Bryobacteraceae bacterium]